MAPALCAAKLPAGAAAFAKSSQRPHSQRRPRQPLVRAEAAAASSVAEPPATDGPNKPDWVGDDKLSQVVNGVIANPVLFQGLKAAARFQIKSQAAKKGVRWDDKVHELEKAGVSRGPPDL